MAAVFVIVVVVSAAVDRTLHCDHYWPMNVKFELLVPVSPVQRRKKEQMN